LSFASVKDLSAVIRAFTDGYESGASRSYGPKTPVNCSRKNKVDKELSSHDTGGASTAFNDA